MRRTELGYAAALVLILVWLVGFATAVHHTLLGVRLDLPGRFVRASMLVLFGFLLLLIARYFARAGAQRGRRRSAWRSRPVHGWRLHAQRANPAPRGAAPA